MEIRFACLLNKPITAIMSSDGDVMNLFIFGNLIWPGGNDLILIYHDG